MIWKYPAEDVGLLPPLVLAYIGDAVFELFIRTRLAAETTKVDMLHREVTGYVNARAMSAYYKKWEPLLTAAETEILRRGRNVKSRQIKSAGVAQYHRSTGFEALVGYLFLSRQEVRLTQLLTVLLEEPNDGTVAYEKE